MTPLVLELQKHALDPDTVVTDLLRMALVVARKLSIREFQDWVELELKGYPDIDQVPSYRLLRGQPVAHNRFRGWETVLTYNLDAQLAENLSTFKINYPIGQIESGLKRPETTAFNVTYDKKTENMLMKALSYPAIPAVQIQSTQFQGILDAVRTIVLEWSLRLEEARILGTDMAFSESEKQAAASFTYNIGYFINQASNSNLQPGEINMGDVYKAGQVAAMGPDANAYDIEFHQIWNQVEGCINLTPLAKELSTLRLAMREGATEPEQDIAVSEIARAEQAAKSGNGAKALGHLRSAGKWALDVATKIGTSLAVEAIKKSMGS